MYKYISSLLLIGVLCFLFSCAKPPIEEPEPTILGKWEVVNRYEYYWGELVPNYNTEKIYVEITDTEFITYVKDKQVFTSSYKTIEKNKKIVFGSEINPLETTVIDIKKLTNSSFILIDGFYINGNGIKHYSRSTQLFEEFKRIN